MQGDDVRDRARIENRSTAELIEVLGSYDLVVIDEAQHIENIGTSLKLVADNIPGIHVIATGSSSFELANRLNEPLTGRNRKFILFPLSIQELVQAHDQRTIENTLEEYMIYGTYPEVASSASSVQKEKAIVHIATDYLFKDIFQLGHIRKPFVFEKIVQLLALRVGSEISYAEIAKEVGISRDILYEYITMLEQAFIIFRLTPLYTNKTKEINKSHKIYFWDTGIRNAILRAFTPMDLRGDKGAIFENFFIAEKMKERIYSGRYTEAHFWRDRAGAEIDFVESTPTNDTIHAYECKWKDGAAVPRAFTTLYPHASFSVITARTLVAHFV